VIDIEEAVSEVALNAAVATPAPLVIRVSVLRPEALKVAPFALRVMEC